MSRRKTLLGNELLQFEQEEVDEGAEKRRRLSIHQNEILRKNKQTNDNNELHKSSLNGSTRQVQVQTPQQPKPSNEQLSCLYNNCVKLLNENKINAKNAFQLKLIDYMSDIVLNKEISGGVTNFQVVGCTIDVGTKIYAARVDALHHNTYQMLDGIRRTGNENDTTVNHLDEAGNEFGADNDEINQEEDDGQHKKNKAKKKRLKKSSQIAENLDSITSKIRDDFQDEDLYFSKISTCIESEAIGGILLNKLHYRDDTCEILINKEENIDSIREEPLETIELNMKDFCQMHKAKHIELRNLKLCSELSNFRFIGWNLDTEDEISKLVQSMSAADDNLEAHRFDANNRNALNLSNDGMLDNFDEDFVNNDVDVDPDIDNLAGSDFNTTENQRGTSIHHSGMEMLDKIDDIRSMNTLNSIADLTTLISNSPSDYSYFNFEKLKLHDLPRHLKRMAIQIQTVAKNPDLTNQNTNSKLVKSGTVRNKKEAPRLDFSIITDLTKSFKVTKKCIYLCDRTLEKRSDKPLWFETERQYDFNPKNMFKAYRKLTMAKIYTDVDQVENLLGNEDIELGKAARPANVVDDDDGHLGGIDDDFEMPCTAQTNDPFYTQNGHEFAQSQQTEHGSLELQQQEIGVLPTFDADNLIEAPLQVNALNIEYAKTSKNIDVRRLKQVIWSLLSDTNDKENIDESVSNDKSKQMLNINASLKEIYKQLRPPLITQKVFDDLSICIVFQMLLFLANEHNLLLKNDPIGSDVIITNY